MIYIATSAFHLSNGFSLSESLGMSVEDGRMLVTCPTNPEGIWDFVKRDQVDALDVDLAQEQGIGVYEKACVGELFARTRTLKSTVDSDGFLQGQNWLRDLAALEVAIHNEVNRYRVKLGLQDLTYNDKVALIARSHSPFYRQTNCTI